MKPIDADRDPAFDGFVARGLERETDASGNACPDADLLAAWFDRSLSPLEAERIEAHSAACGSCQQILADLARSEPEVTRAAPVPAPARPWHWHWRWLAPLATAVVVLVVGTRTLRAPSEVPSDVLLQMKSKESEMARTMPPMSPPVPVPGEERPAIRPESALESKGETARALQKPAPGAVQPEVPRNLTLAESVVTAVAPPPAAAPPGRADVVGVVGGIARDKSIEARPGLLTERAVVQGQAPSAAAGAGASARPTALTRETPEPLLVTSAAAPPGNGVTWRYGQGGVIERSTDRGQTWERQRSGVTAALTDGSAPTDRICWIVGARGVVLRTTDGSTWVRVASPTMVDLVSVHAWNDANSTITAADHTEYVTTDGGASWRKR